MRKISILVALLVTAPFVAARSPKSGAADSAPNSALAGDARDAARRKAREQERAELAPLFAREHGETTAILARKGLSDVDKRSQTEAIRRKYLDQRNVVRLRIRTQLRAQLLGVAAAR